MPRLGMADRFAVVRHPGGERVTLMMGADNEESAWGLSFSPYDAVSIGTELAALGRAMLKEQEANIVSEEPHNPASIEGPEDMLDITTGAKEQG